MLNLNFNKLALLAVTALMLTQNVRADDVTNARLEALQQQIQTLSAELRTIQDQLAKAREDNTLANSANTETVIEKTPSRSNGEPVYASFKDGLVFGDESGNWSFQPNGRIQADYHNVAPTQWKNDTFTIRRARLGAALTAYKDFVVRVEGELANSNDGAKGSTGLTYG